MNKPLQVSAGSPATKNRRHLEELGFTVDKHSFHGLLCEILHYCRRDIAGVDREFSADLENGVLYGWGCGTVVEIDAAESIIADGMAAPDPPTQMMTAATAVVTEPSVRPMTGQRLLF